MKFLSTILAFSSILFSHGQELDIVDTLIQENTATNGLFDTTIAAVVALNLTDTLKSLEDFTLFAPEESAWAALGLNSTTIAFVDPTIATNVLLYHLVDGFYDSQDVISASSLTTFFYNQTFGVNGTLLTDGNGGVSNIVSVDTEASNAIIHSIDNVLVPADLVTTAIALNSEGPYAGSFDILISALTNASLVNALKFPEGPYTVFAPVDSAFEALGLDETSVTSLDPTALQTILLAHVVSGYYNAETVVELGHLDTLVENVIIHAENANGTFDDNYGTPFNVIVPDVYTVNGVIHAIDTVINTGAAGL